MPEGTLISRDLTLAVAPAEAIHDLQQQLVPHLAHAGCKLKGTTADTVTLSRRYLPGTAMILAWGVVLLTVLVQFNADGRTSPLVVAAWLAALVLVFYRRTEVLTATVRDDSGDSRILIAGHASPKAIAAIEEYVGARTNDSLTAG